MRTCTVDGCQRKYYGNGYCAMHYKRVRRSGDPLSVKHIRHGMSGSPEYRVWSLMHQRCSNPNSVVFKYYGGRGIRVCDRWSEFPEFYSDMGARPSQRHEIDRADNDKGYSPENCRWVLPEENSRNRSSTKLSHYAVRDIRSNQICGPQDLADKYGVTVAYIWRIKQGRFWSGVWPFPDVIPVNKQSPQEISTEAMTLTPELAYEFLHEHHCSVSEVAAYASVSPRQVLRMSAGWANGSVQRERRRVAKKMARESDPMNWKVVMKRLGCSRATAFRVIKKIKGSA